MKRVVVYHSSYGCDTGCCGHTVAIMPEDWNYADDSADSVIWENRAEKTKFHFSHPYSDDFKEYAKELVEKTYGKDHVADLDWEHSFVTDECWA
jgi:hypothetical protein